MEHSRKFQLGDDHFWSYITKDKNGNNQVTYIVNGDSVDAMRFNDKIMIALTKIDALHAVVAAVQNYVFSMDDNDE